MNKNPKQSWPRIYLLLSIIVGAVIGFWIGRREEAAILSRFASIAAEEQLLHRFTDVTRYTEVASEEWDHTSSYWDSKPEIARALLERDLRTELKVLDALKQISVSDDPKESNVKDVRLALQRKEISTTHMRLAILCQKLSDLECATYHVDEIMRLRDLSSNEVYAAMAKLEATDSAHRLNPPLRLY